jgi:hypothetical protein
MSEPGDTRSELIRDKTPEQLVGLMRSLHGPSDAPPEQVKAQLDVSLVREMQQTIGRLITTIDYGSTELRASIEHASKSGEQLQNELVKLNRRLFWATVVIAVATIAGVVAAFLQWAA